LTTSGLPNLLRLIVFGGIITAVIVGVVLGTVVVLKRRGLKTQSVQPLTPPITTP